MEEQLQSNHSSSTCENPVNNSPYMVGVPNEFLSLSDQTFENRDELISVVRKIRLLQGYVLVIRRSKVNNYVIMGCDRGGLYRTKTSHVKKKNKSSSRKIDCPFKIVGRRKSEGLWRVEITSLEHNHELSIDMAGHPYCRRFTEDEALHVKQMSRAAKVGPNVATNTAHALEQKLITLIRSCKSPEHLRQIQSQIITTAIDHQTHLVTSHFLSKCSELKRIDHARKVFDQMPDRTHTSLWNVISNGYLRNDAHAEVMPFFALMTRENVRPNCYTLPVVLKSCCKLSALREGEQVHSLAIKNGFSSNTYVGTNLIELYSGSGHVGPAFRVFTGMALRNVVSWTAMINGYVANNDLVSARRLFDLSPERDVVLWNRMITGYVESGDMVEAKKLFDSMPGKDLMSFNTLLHGYANNGDVEGCEKFFESMVERNIFSWNGLINGYYRGSRFLEVLGAFRRMLRENNVCPNDSTLVNVLSACSKLGNLEFGKRVHSYAEINGYKCNLYVCNGLIDMYAKCGNVDSAIGVFKGMDKKDLITWNTIINALAVHGHGDNALVLFDEMIDKGQRPDGVTFIGVLCACSHIGLVKDGLDHFRSMSDEYSIDPKIEHYGCVVDLLARNGLLDRALEFVDNMPIEADGVIWTALLGASRVHKRVDLAEVCMKKLVEDNPAKYVMLSNVYGEARRWDELARLKVAVRDSGSKKVPGLSWIETDDGLFEFCSFDERHSRAGEMYYVLRGLMKVARLSGCCVDFLEM